MTHSSESLATPRRMSVSLKLGAVFLLLAALATANLYFADRLHDSIVNISGIVNQSGRLRYLSQQIALRSAGFVLEPDADVGQSAREMENEFGRHYARVVHDVEQLPLLMHNAETDLRGHLDQIGSIRPLQHAALEQVLAGADLEARRMPQGAVAAYSVLLLRETDQLVNDLEYASQTGHRRVNFIVYSVQALELLIMFWIFLYLRSRVTAPILKLADFSRRFAAGERAMRLDFHSSDEIGELVLTFNTTAAQTTELIEELDRRGRENAALATRLQSSLDFHLKLMQEFPNPIWRVDRNGKCDYVNRAWLDFTGRTVAQELGDGWADGVHPEDRERCLGMFLSAFNRREPFAMEYRTRHRDGSYHWLLDHGAPFTDLDGEFAGYLGACYDIEESRHYQSQLEYQAQHDALTGLPNRNLLADRIDQAISHAGRHGKLVGVLFVDLDNFKVINDSLGHETGDRLLKAVGERLAAVVRAGDTVARHGGDEFVVVLADMAQEDDVVNTARKLTAVMAAPFTFDGRDLVATASLGIAFHPRDGEDAATLLRNADTALYRAKDAGRNTFRCYAADMNEQMLARLNLERDMRQALERGEFLLHYQPKVDLAGGAIVGTEALVRWHHPVQGIVFPGEFIPQAEATGLIVPLGAWVLREACRQAKVWHVAGLSEMRMSVNLSARQFHAPDLTQTILDILAETGLEARFLELEITESMVMHDPERAITVLDELERHGIAFAVDDFGTGYSSLSYLKRFPIHKLKIDQSFVRNVTTDPDDAAIATAVIGLAHSLKLKVVAEGVETEEQRAFLRTHQCDEMQGYFFSRPVSAEEMDVLLIANKQFLAAPVVEREETRTLLLVDDEESILNALNRLLRRDGYHILRTTSPHEALKLLARHPVGVVLSDQRMPEMSGTDFLRRVKDIYPNTVRIVLSGYTELKSVTDAINEGAVYKFITKPWEDEALRNDIREAFRRFETGREHQRLTAHLVSLVDQVDRARHTREARTEAQSGEAANELDLLRASRSALESLPMGVVGVTAEGCITTANRAAEKLLGLSPGELRDGGVERLPAAIRAVLEDAFAGHAVPATPWRTPDGRESILSCHREANGAVIIILMRGE